VALSEGSWPEAATPNVPGTASSKTRRNRLFHHLCDAFDLEEFKSLCFLLGVNIDDLPGDRKSAQVRELVLVFERKHDLDVLEEAMRDLVSGTK
jgi:hypothetical protein